MIAATLAQLAFNDTLSEHTHRRLSDWCDSDWRALFRLADDEDMLCLIVARLISIPGLCPPPILDEVQPRVLQRRQWSSLRVNLMHEILTGLEAAGIAARTIKGFALGQDLYGDAFLRDSHDVDLIVTPENAHTAARWLTGKGYSAACNVDWFKDAGFLSARREAAFASLGGVLEIDLHWRIDQPWSPQITSIDRLLNDSPRPLQLGDRTIHWHSHVNVALIQASNIVNTWDTELRSVVDFARSVARLTPEEVQTVQDGFDAGHHVWVLHVLANVAKTVCAIAESSFDHLKPLSGRSLNRKVSTVVDEMVTEAFDPDAGNDNSSARRNNRRFVHGLMQSVRLVISRSQPGLADYANVRPNDGSSVRIASMLRRVRALAKLPAG